MYLDLVGLRHQDLQVSYSRILHIIHFIQNNAFIFFDPLKNISFIAGGVADPFTGSGAYSSQPMEVDSIEDASQYFPQTTYLQFTQVFELIIARLENLPH